VTGTCNDEALYDADHALYDGDDALDDGDNGGGNKGSEEEEEDGYDVLRSLSRDQSRSRTLVSPFKGPRGAPADR
jgi:hypothetical protein